MKKDVEKFLTGPDVEYYFEKTEFAEVIIVVFVQIPQIQNFVNLFKSYLDGRICEVVLNSTDICIPRFEKILEFYKIPLGDIFILN